jgi:glycerophosphoryl diester phosphodiesterase
MARRLGSCHPVPVASRTSQGIPQVIAHRGASAYRAEHTLAAYELAIEQGADALECDVRLTADGHLVCVHDRRIDRTSNGWGVVSTKTLEQLDAHDYGLWNDQFDAVRRRPMRERVTAARRERAGMAQDVPVLDTGRHRILTLPTLIELALSAPRPIGLAIETKHPTRFAGWVEHAVVAQLRRYGLTAPRDGTSRVQVMSFSAQALRRMRTLAPGVPRVFLMDRVPIRMRSGLLPFGSTIAGPDVAIIRAHPGYVRRVHEAGGAVHVWTVDEEPDIQLCCDLGVDAVITNQPGVVRAVLGSR